MGRKRLLRTTRQTNAETENLKTSAGTLPAIPLAVVLAIILAGIPFLLGKYIELNSPGPYDSGAYVYSAQHILKGARLGVDETPSARPGTLLVNLIGVKLFGFNETGPKLIQALMQAAALVMMFIAMRKLFGSIAAVTGVTLAAFYLSAPVIAKYGNVKEQYMIAVMVIAGACFIIRQIDGNWLWAMASGAAAINVPYFKATGISILTAIVFYELMAFLLKSRPKKLIAMDIAGLACGAAIGILPLLGLALQQGYMQLLVPSFLMAGLKLLAFIGILIAIIYAAVKIVYRTGTIGKIRTVNRNIWIAGLVVIAITFAVSLLLIRHQAKKTGMVVPVTEEIASYLWDLPFVKIPLQIIGRIQRGIGSMTSGSGYLGQSKSLRTFEELAPQILRYYRAVGAVTLLSIVSVITGLLRLILSARKKIQLQLADRLILFVGLWWVLDTAFVWISPRSYEQYYLPMAASGALCGGYILWLYSKKMSASPDKSPWFGAGALSAICLVIIMFPACFGFSKSPDTGVQYTDGQKNPIRRRGFAQSLDYVSGRKKGLIPTGDREVLGDYINGLSDEDDRIYVWGWFPGIYVQAQRLSCVPRAFESDMHVKHPILLMVETTEMVEQFKKTPPKFIVDSRKRHFPNDRPPLELWPKDPRSKTFLRPGSAELLSYEQGYRKALADNIDKGEARRFDAMKSLRDFVMQNYEPVKKTFGIHILFRLKEPAD